MVQKVSDFNPLLGSSSFVVLFGPVSVVKGVGAIVHVGGNSLQHIAIVFFFLEPF